MKTNEQRARYIALIMIAATTGVMFLLNIPGALDWIKTPADAVYFGFGMTGYIGMLFLYFIAGIGLLVALGAFYKWAFYLLTAVEALFCLGLLNMARGAPAFLLVLGICALILAPHVYYYAAKVKRDKGDEPQE